jgi:hypothetical protein
MGLSNFDEKYAYTNFLSADSGFGTSDTGFVAGVGYDRRIDFLIGSNSDTIDHAIELGFAGDAGFQTFASAIVPAGAGYGGLAAVDVLALGLPPNMVGLVVPASFAFAVRIPVAITGAGVVGLLALGGRL